MKLTQSGLKKIFRLLMAMTLKQFSSKGGKSRSRKKLLAVKRNLRVARKARKK